MHMGLRRSTRTRLARLPIGCHAIYKTNDNGGIISHSTNIF